MNRRSLLTPAAAGSVMLTMLSLNQVFVRQRWLFPSILGVCLAFAVGWAARRLDVPAILSPALSMLALVTMLGLFFHPGTTALGIPTGDTMRAIGESLRQAGLDLQDYGAPAEPTKALTLLAVGGVFLVAVVVDVLVFRLRRPVAAGIPLLALFLIPTSLAEKGNAFAFILAAFGYLGLLVAEGRDRARAWGRRLSGVERASEFADVSHVARVGRRLGSAAVGLALALPVALPSVGDGIFSGTGSGPFGGGNGPARVVVVSPIVEISKQLHQDGTYDLFTVRPHDRAWENGYTRLTSLDEFTGNEWRLMEQQADSDNKVGRKNPIPQPREHQAVALTERTYDVEVGPLAVQWLPLPYSPSVVDISGDWKYESQTLSVFTARNRKTSQGAEYTVTSLLPTPTADQLRQGGAIPDAIAKRYLRLPGRPPHPEVKAIVDQLTEGKETAYDKAVAIQTYFLETGGFTYDLNAPVGTGEDDLANFLEVKRGYCEQFAATMGYMARLSGIPARVAVGFTRGTQRPDGTWVVTNKDAHAWPELYFPSAGWVRFEPTPRSDQQTVTPSYAPIQTTPTGPGTTPTPTPAPGETPAPDPDESAKPRAFDEAQGQDQPVTPLPDLAAPEAGGGGPSLTLLAVAGLVAVAVATPSLVAFAARRRRRRVADGAAERTHAAWDTLSDAAEDAGYPLRSSESPRASARRLVAAAGLDGSAAAEVDRLAAAEERARYARSAPEVDGLDGAAREVRRALMASLSRRRRVRATVFPASSLRRMRNGYASAVDTVDRTGTALRARLVALVRRRALPGRV